MIDKYRFKNKLNKILFIFIILIVYILSVNVLGEFNKEYNISIGDNYTLDQRFPILLSASDITKSPILEVTPLKNPKLKISNSFKLKTLDKGTVSFKLKVFGVLPYKNIIVNVVPQMEVIPGGHSIGVRLNTDGVLVVGISEITDIYGKVHNIAESGGVRIGDSLMSINDIKVTNALHVGEIISNSYGKELKFTFMRDSKIYTTFLSPIKSTEDEKYRLGLWVRDKTAGVGTMTFYHPESKKFGALGHAITDIDTGKVLSIKDGKVIKSKVMSIQEGKKGKPGEIRGGFYDINEPLGELEKNNGFGVYGELVQELDNNFYKNPIPIAYQHEIKEGPAHILTTIDSEGVKKYDIEILKINPQTKIDGKSMIIRVTDKELLKRTGGIIQGMSGSPIIQNNKIIGAVTHVLINDPTKGYGIFIEWMVQESGVYNKIIKTM